MANLSLKITSPERVLLEEDATEIIVPTTSGQLTILPNHATLVSELTSGEMIIRNGKEEKIAIVFGGFLHVRENNKIIILADSAEHLHEVTEKEAEEAKKKAEAFMQEVIDDKERFADAQAELIKSLTRLNIARKHRGKRGIHLE